ncbi:MAG: hypothetical protein F6K36_19210 [Symploca sp. SIO3C6]|nr:hypothetical protein [Symploca sp. SIO3C6]
MQNLTKVFSVIMVVALWLSGIASPALGQTISVDPVEEVTIICDDQQRNDYFCDFNDAKFCNASLCKRDTKTGNLIPAKAKHWQYRVYNESDQAIFLQQTRNKSCQLITPEGGNKIESEAQSDNPQGVAVDYYCQIYQIPYLANYITVSNEDAKPIIGKVKFRELKCSEN